MSLLEPGGGQPPIIERAKPGTTMDGPRLLVCFDCHTMTKVPPYQGPPEFDRELDRSVALHQHLEIPEVSRSGGRLFTTTQETWDHLDPVEEIRQEMLRNGEWIQEYRSQVSEDAVKCHREHGQPDYPGRPCIDYKTEKKRLGGGLSVKVDPAKRDPKKLQYLCTYCPYESTVVTKKRWDRGDYNL